MRNFWIDCFLATILVFLFMWGILKITQLNVFNAFDSIGNALGDVEMTDYVFSGLRDEPNVEENIVVVNIGNLNRRQVAQLVQIVSQHKPKVIGLDSFFDCSTGLRDTVNCPQLKDTLGNLMLAEAIREAGNVILVTKLLQSDSLARTDTEDVYDSLERSDALFVEAALGEGYASLETDAAYQDDVKTCRTFNPQMKVNGEQNLAFAVKMAMVYNPDKAKKFLERNNFSEVINYRGNVMDIFHQTGYPQMFYTLDVVDVVTENFVPEMIKDKMVIFGFLGKELGDTSWDDKFYTPLNKDMAGKANPDMFGVVVHANIASMILNEDYVERMAEWQEIFMAFVICLLNVALFSLINKNLPQWYDGITKLLQLGQLILYTMGMVMIFHKFSFKLNITYTLVAVALVGDVFEIYTNVFKTMGRKLIGWLGFTNTVKQVLSS